MSKRLKKLLEWVAAGLVTVLLLSVVGAIGLARWSHGFSARDEPPTLEKTLARRLRNWAQPDDARKLQNPVPLTPEVLKEARAHFADHCASCHGNDGRGKTEMGQHLYPRAPDMTAEGTQSLTDGELFHIIKHGVRLTGMPAWGADPSQDDDLATWKLVRFIRHLPRLSPSELQEMERLNPKGPEQSMSEEEEEKFLEGKDEEPSASPSPHRMHH